MTDGPFYAYRGSEDKYFSTEPLDTNDHLQRVGEYQCQSKVQIDSAQSWALTSLIPCQGPIFCQLVSSLWLTKRGSRDGGHDNKKQPMVRKIILDHQSEQTQLVADPGGLGFTFIIKYHAIFLSCNIFQIQLLTHTNKMHRCIYSQPPVLHVLYMQRFTCLFESVRCVGMHINKRTKYCSLPKS